MYIHNDLVSDTQLYTAKLAGPAAEAGLRRRQRRRGGDRGDPEQRPRERLLSRAGPRARHPRGQDARRDLQDVARAEPVHARPRARLG